MLLVLGYAWGCAWRLMPGLVMAQDMLPTPGQATPWLDLEAVSSAPVEGSTVTAESPESKGPAPLKLDWETLRLDLAVIQQSRQSLERALEYAQQRRDPEAWNAALNYALALDSMAQYYGKFFIQASPDKPEALEYPGSFFAYYAAFMAESRWALDWMIHFGGQPAKVISMDKTVPGLGLPSGAFTHLRSYITALQREKAFAAIANFYVQLRQLKSLRWFWERKEVVFLNYRLERDARRLSRTNTSAEGQNDAAWSPYSSWIGQWLDVDLAREDLQWVLSEPGKRMSEKEIWYFNDRLEPGDIILERREPFRSDVGLPGYWNYAALYVGSPEERKRFFGRASIDSQLKTRFPQVYASAVNPVNDHPIRILESGPSGVAFASLEQAMMGDAYAVVRPQLSKEERAAAIWRAFGYVGRPYDVDFDLDANSGLTGAELIYQIYRPEAGHSGIRLHSTRFLGRRTVSANDIAKKFDDEFGIAGQGQQLDLVWFVERRKGSRRVAISSLEEFRRSWRRPQWIFPIRANEENTAQRSP